MWLDRLGHTNPQLGGSDSRPISPLPRRVSVRGSPYITSQQRSARASTSSLVSTSDAGSTTSLLRSAASNRVNGTTGAGGGSSLKQSLTVDDGSESLSVLGKIIGSEAVQESSSSSQNGHAPRSTVITEEDLDLVDFDLGGFSLRDYLARGELDADNDGTVYRSQTVEEYDQDKTKFEDLHRSIRACDDVLTSVETNLTSFRNDLAAVSADIESLQARSTALNVRLENRQKVEKGLGPVVEELSVSPLVVSKIVDGPIDEAWVKVLAEVEKRSEAYKKNAKQQQQGQSRALTDMGPLLDKLTSKAIERIRDHLVAQIKALRSPHINAQIIQQQNFLRFKELYTYLHRHHANLAGEICQAYMNTMRWYYVTQFTRYQKALEKIKLHVIDKTDVLGHEETTSRTKATAMLLGGGGGGGGLGGGGARSPLGGPPHDAFSLGRRIDLLRTTHQAAISSYLAEDDPATHYLEVPFRHFNVALVDNATAEYTFLAAFFGPAVGPARVGRTFHYVFEPTFRLGHALTRALAAETYDGLGLLLCIRLNQRLAFELQRRRVPAVDGYVNGTAMALWPRLQGVMDAHCESVRHLTSALPARALPAATARATPAAPHVATQRFGQLVHGILALSAEAWGGGGDDGNEPVAASLGRLRSEVEAFLTRYSQAYFGAADKTSKKRERFLYNNYSLVLTIIGDAGGAGKLARDQVEHFEGLKRAFQDAA